LGTSNLLVYMTRKKNATDASHQIDYGGYVSVLVYNGVYWYGLTSTSIIVNRHQNGVNWNYVRIQIWKIPA